MEERIQAIVTSDNEITAVMNAKQQMQAVVDRGVTVFVPVTSTTNLGIMKVGEGLLVNNGLVSVNPDIIKIEHISLNGNLVEPDADKSVNLLVDKTTVGLSNVDNTSDASKPISEATQYALDQKLDIQQDVINFDKILYIKSDGTIGFKTENVEINKDAFVNVSLNATNGLLQFATQDGRTVTVDFPLEDIVKNGYYDDTTEEIVLVLKNDNEIRFSASKLIDIYEGDNVNIEVVTDAETGAKTIQLTSDATAILSSVALKANKTVAMGDFTITTDNTGRIITFYPKNVNGDNIGQPKVVTLPAAVVSGEYVEAQEKIILTLVGGAVVPIDMRPLLEQIDVQIIHLNNKKVNKQSYFTVADVDELFEGD